MVSAHKGDRKKALADLKQAVAKGLRNLKAVEQEEAFADLRQEEGYREVVKALTPGPSPSLPTSPPGGSHES